MPRGIWGGVPAAPRGNLNLLLSFHTFLKGLYSFYLRKRDQPVGKWGRRWGGWGGNSYDTAAPKCKRWDQTVTRAHTHAEKSTVSSVK